MFGKIGTSELIIILSVAVLIFGPKKIPELGKAIGKTIGNFKRSMKEIDEIENVAEDSHLHDS